MLEFGPLGICAAQFNEQEEIDRGRQRRALLATPGADTAQMIEQARRLHRQDHRPGHLGLRHVQESNRDASAGSSPNPPSWYRDLRARQSLACDQRRHIGRLTLPERGRARDDHLLWQRRRRGGGPEAVPRKPCPKAERREQPAGAGAAESPSPRRPGERVRLLRPLQRCRVCRDPEQSRTPRVQIQAGASRRPATIPGLCVISLAANSELS